MYDVFSLSDFEALYGPAPVEQIRERVLPDGRAETLVIKFATEFNVPCLGRNMHRLLMPVYVSST